MFNFHTKTIYLDTSLPPQTKPLSSQLLKNLKPTFTTLILLNLYQSKFITQLRLNIICGYIHLIILFMIRTCTKLIRFTVSVPRIDYAPSKIKKQLQIDFFPIVGIRERKLGACILNQPANQNLLTQQFVDELYRFLVSYQYDNTVENVWIESKEGVFSHGVDYKRLTQDKNYLDKLYKLAILFANFNKPMFAQVAGGVKGAGAYLLSMINMPLGYKHAFLKLDEVSRGLVPLLGGSHRLARMPLHLGYYLALVGDEFNAEQMAQIGLLKGSIPQGVSNSQIRQKFHEANLYFRQKFRYMDFDKEQSLLQAQQQINLQQKKQQFDDELKFFQAEMLAESPRNINVKFAVNQHLIARVNYQNVTNPYNSFYQSQSGRNINNYYQMRFERPLKYLFEHKVVNHFNIDGIQLNRLDLGRIDVIFGKDTLVQVLEALKEEKTEWAERAYRRITESDPLAALLTFQLIKNAQESSWIACIQREFAVARRLLQISKLELKTFKNSSHYVLTNTYSNKKIPEIQKSIVKRFFSKPTGQSKLEHTVKQYSLLPACDYYKDVPDSIRAYLNQTEFVDKHYTQQLPQIKRFLKLNHINFKSKVYDVAILRKKVYEKLQTQKVKELFTKRFNYLASNDHYLQIYKTIRENHLESTSNQSLETLIESTLQKVFKSKFQNRYAQFEKKTAKMIGLQTKLEFFKKVKDIILNNLIYKGYQYEQSKKGKTEFQGLIYFDPKGKDIYSSTNSYLQGDKVFKQLASYFAKRTSFSEKNEKQLTKPLPKFFATKDKVMPRQAENIAMWEKIKERYDEKPEIWAEAYTYKELIIQASRTSQELAGYLDWTFQNFHDLLNYSEKGRQTYGQYASEMVNEVEKMRRQKVKKLKQVQKQLTVLATKQIHSKPYQLKNQIRMREVFPFYYNENTIPLQFRRSFLSVLDSTLQEFTAIYTQRNKGKLLINEQLGVLDRWINVDLTTEYTNFLKNDVQYVTSYLMILFVKDMLSEMAMHQLYDRPLNDTLAIFLEKYNVDFKSTIGELNEYQLNKAITKFLYFLVDMHTNAKSHIKSPQSKLIDFINRLKTNYQFNQDHSLPYSFEGLLLLIGKDRKKIFDAFLGQSNIAEPEFLLQYITREARKTSADRVSDEDYEDQGIKQGLKNHFYQHYNSVVKSKHLVQNYFYYMMLFEKHIHELCGKESFIPENFVNPEHQMYNKYCQDIISSDSNSTWLQKEIKAVIEQLLSQRHHVQQTLTKGQLFLYDQKFSKQLQPQNFKKLIKDKLTQEVFLVKNMFSDKRQYELVPNEEQAHDLYYTKVKRTIKNPQALKKLNNLSLSEQIYLEYMTEVSEKDDLPRLQKKFVEDQRVFYKNGMASRLPFKSYHRMARDVFVYPEDMVSLPESERQLTLFKKTNINFKRALSGEKIELSPFGSQYKELKKEDKSQILKEMVNKITMIESL